MTRQQIIDEIADDRVRLVSQFRHDPANQGVAASVPFQINRAVRGLTMDFSPAVGPPGALMFSGNQIEPLELRISHDLFPQRSTPGRDDLDHCLHPTSFSRKSSLLQCLFGTKGPKPGLQEASGTSRKRRYNPFQDVETRRVKCRQL
jgi:hypothetical protein